MVKLNRRAFMGGSAAAVAIGFAPAGRAQPLSATPITAIVPFSAGSGADTLARQFAAYLGSRYAQTAIVENRVGASGNIGTSAVVRAAADGKTLLLTANTVVMNVSLYKNARYNPSTDLVPILGLAATEYGLAVHKSVPAKTLSEFIELARRRPGELDFGSPGLGTPHHLGLELLNQSARIQLKHVRYSALSGAVQDVAGGHIAGMVLPAAQAIQLALTGNVSVLAVTGKQRLDVLPNVPTFAEAGLPDLAVESWWGIFAPAGTDGRIVAWYNKAGNEFLADPNTRKQLAEQVLQPIGGPPEDLRDLVARDLVKWERIISAAKISLE